MTKGKKRGVVGGVAGVLQEDADGDQIKSPALYVDGGDAVEVLTRLPQRVGRRDIHRRVSRADLDFGWNHKNRSPSPDRFGSRSDDGGEVVNIDESDDSSSSSSSDSEGVDRRSSSPVSRRISHSPDSKCDDASEGGGGGGGGRSRVREGGIRSRRNLHYAMTPDRSGYDIDDYDDEGGGDIQHRRRLSDEPQSRLRRERTLRPDGAPPKRMSEIPER